MSTPKGDAPYRTLRAGRVDLDEARLRMVGAVVCSLGAGLYALSRPGPFSIVVSLTVIAASWTWSRRAMSAAARAPLEVLLDLAPTGFTLAPAAQVPWSAVTGVEVDEDRLVVLVHRMGGDPVVIEPVYDGISVYDLAALFERCRSFGQSRTG
jgi:hypothetical protein